MISEDDVLSPKSSTPSVSAVRAIHLERVLRRLLPGWNRINPQVYALTTRRAKFVDTTLCPAEENDVVENNACFQKWSRMGNF